MPADSSDTPPRRALPKLWSPDQPSVTPVLRPLNGGRPAPAAAAEQSDETPPPPVHRQRSTARTYLALPFTRSTVAAAKKASQKPSSIRYSPTIKELPLTDRPRERLAIHGAQALTTAELLAILIRVGSSERSAVSLGEQLLAHFGSVNEVAGASVEELSAVKGIGDAKAAQIKAAIEFGKRVSLLGAGLRPYIASPGDAVNLVISDLRYLKKETLKSILLDTKGRVISIKTVSIGDLSTSIVHPREFFKDAVIASAASVIAAHNHPSGDPTPSPEDVNVTRRLISAGEILGIELVDHVVIGDGNFVSLKERGLI